MSPLAFILDTILMLAFVLTILVVPNIIQL